ncbi:MAG: hypothetical protein NC342_08215 [Pseudoflavonifractor sp.]|nr:hypothetical protein [Alloprevotella sp.]MCM1117505.1 hypothetical protein [Pseudoflavonifractor sp.]
MNTIDIIRNFAIGALALIPMSAMAQFPAGATDNIVDNDSPVSLRAKVQSGSRWRDGYLIGHGDNTVAAVASSGLNGDSAVWLVFNNTELGRTFIVNYGSERFLGSDGSEARLFDNPRSLRLFCDPEDTKRAIAVDRTNGGTLGLPIAFGGTNLILDTDSAKAIPTLSLASSSPIAGVAIDPARVKKLQEKCSTKAVTEGAMASMQEFVDQSRAAAQEGMESYVGVPRVDLLAEAIARKAPLDELEVIYDDAQASIYPQAGHYYRLRNISRPDNGAMTNVLSIIGSDTKHFRCYKLEAPAPGATGNRAEDLSLFSFDADPAAPNIAFINPAAHRDMWLNNWGNTSISAKSAAHSFLLEKRDASPYHFRLTRTDNGNYLTISGDHMLVSYGQQEEPEWFYLEEVTELPLTLSAEGIASITLPCPVELPAGVEAYIVPTANSTAVQVMKIGSTIPAYTPVIVKGAPEAELTLKVLPGEYTLTAENLLEGALIKSDRADRYIAGLDADGALCFKRARSTVNANEAYVANSLIHATLDTLPTTTETLGIEGVESDNNATATPSGTYDLQGRRVARPAKGSIYIIDGQKTLVK